MDKKLVADILAYVFKLKFVEGYRTYISAAGLFALAVYLLAQGQYEQAITNLSLALAALGIREKVGEATQALEPVPKAEPEPTGDPAILQFPQGGPQGSA